MLKFSVYQIFEPTVFREDHGQHPAKNGPPHFGFIVRSGFDSRLTAFMIAQPGLVLCSLDTALAESSVSDINHQTNIKNL
ncbi:hypothetical protein [Methylicorpusculum sp.]|uniref:hypothetical protein n=1 Tax=Methylicorpusculum sp. TaxID=2713644 RepID=UPI0027262F47|nr:hypothetical protein [Methylicorpusculum sp.]MDO8846522.1 hypothetical protein [Methylicorpusculum sp.]